MSEVGFLVASALSKSYVGGGAYRPLSSLSGQARKVVRRNIERDRQARLLRSQRMNPSMLGVRPGFGSSPQHRAAQNIRAGLKLAPLPGVGSIAGKGRVASSIPNVSFTADSPASSRAVVERTLAGRKARNPVVFDTTGRPSNTQAGWAADGSGGRAKTVRVPAGAKGFNPRLIRHEFEHANAGTRKGRLTSLSLRRNPRRSVMNEEARADAASGGSKRRPLSDYGPQWGADSQYARRYRELTGRTPRMRGVTSLRDEASFVEGFPRGEVPKGELKAMMPELRAATRQIDLDQVRARRMSRADPLREFDNARRRLFFDREFDNARRRLFASDRAPDRPARDVPWGR